MLQKEEATDAKAEDTSAEEPEAEEEAEEPAEEEEEEEEDEEEIVDPKEKLEEGTLKIFLSPPRTSWTTFIIPDA